MKPTLVIKGNKVMTGGRIIADLDEVSDEERRFYEQHAIRLDPPMREASPRHPDFSPGNSQQDSGKDAERRAIRRLLVIFGVPILVLIGAEVTGTLIGQAWLLAILVAVAGTSFYVGFVSREPYFFVQQAPARGGFVVLLAVIGLTAYFGVREMRTVGELTALIAPVPEITGILYLPTGPELQAISSAIGQVDVESASPPDFSEMIQRYWKLETALSPEEVMAFYELETNRTGWDVVVRDGPFLQLQRGRETMTLFLSDSGWAPKTSVWYIYEEHSGP